MRFYLPMDSPDIWTASGLVLALVGVGAAMISVPGAERWEFLIARACFICAALIFLGKLAVWGMADLNPYRLGAVAAGGAVLALALTVSLQWITAKQQRLVVANSTTSQPSVAAAPFNDDLRVKVREFTTRLRQFGVQMQIKENEQSRRRTEAMKSVRTPGSTSSPLEDKASIDMWQKQNDIASNERIQTEADFTSNFRLLAINYRTSLLSALQKEGKVYVEDRSDTPTKWTQDFINDNRFMGQWTIDAMADYYERLNSML